MNRRRFLRAGGAALATGALPATARQGAQPAQDLAALLDRLAGATRAEPGGVEIELPPIAENGHSVPLRVRVASPMTPADHVRAIHVVAERNPRPLVATFRLGPDSGRAEVATRMRLAGSQKVRVIVQLSGGRHRLAEADVLVASAACLDESF